MSIISVSLPSDGSTADVSDYNTPVTTIVNAINGGLDNSNIASGAAIDGSKLAGGSSTMFSAMQSYTPTLGADGGGTPGQGNGTFTCAYVQVGKIVTVRFKFVVGSTTNFGTGSFTFTLPVTANAAYSSNYFAGTMFIFDVSAVADYGGFATIMNTTAFKIEFHNDTVGGGMRNASGSASQPFGWATGDTIAGTLTYEAA